MKFVVIFAIIAAWVSGSDAVTCENVSTCTPDVSQLSGGSTTQEDIKKACMSMKDAMQCFRDAIGDCRKNTAIPEGTITNLESQIDSYEQMISSHCGDMSNSANAAKVTAFTFLAAVFAAVL